MAESWAAVGTLMSPQEYALAHCASYQLLARLFSEPISAEIATYLDTIPNLNPNYATLDEAQVAFQQLFGFNVFPHESIFLGRDGLIGGTISDQIIAHYQHGGFHWQGDADHLSNQLRFMAFLAGAEADAWEDKLPTVAQAMQQRQGDFLQQHLLRWLPPFVIATQQHGDSFYRAATDLLWQLVANHARQLRCFPQQSDPVQQPDLSDEQTSLKSLVRFLVTPLESGWWLSAMRMGEIGRNLNLPRGFGGRTQTLMNLFRSATQFDATTTLLHALEANAEQWLSAYVQLGDFDKPAGKSAEFVKMWQDRLIETQKLLQNMQSTLNNLGQFVQKD